MLTRREETAALANRPLDRSAQPGYAGSDPLGPRADIADHVFHLADLLDPVGLGRVDLVGASLGGWLAAEFALRGVLFADPEGAIALDALPDDLPRDGALRWFGGLARGARLDRAQLCNPKLAGRLTRFGAPTLMVWGEGNRVATDAPADVWRTGVPDARLESSTVPVMRSASRTLPRWAMVQASLGL